MSIYILTDKILGNGSFGKVILAENAVNGELFAAKELSKEIYQKKDLIDLLENEILISTSFMNPNLIKISDIVEIASKNYLLFEYCNGGDLESFMMNYKMKSGTNFNEKTVQYILKQVLNGLSCLHRNKIIHHDIKPANILLKFKNKNDMFNILDSEIKISDFGLAKFKDQNANNAISGTPLYMDPTVFGSDVSIEKEYVDIWSIGILTIYLLTGQHPFIRNSYEGLEDLIANIKKGYFTINKEIVSKQVISFINSCLQIDPAQRLSADELMYHEFISRDIEFFEGVQVNSLPKEYIGYGNRIMMNAYDNKQLSLILGM